MIGKLTGRVDYITSDHALIDAGDVGYLVFCSERTLASFPAPGERVAVYTELLVRENILQLFGFRTRLEREFYRLLLSVQGVGSKGAIGVLGAVGAEGGMRALALGDWNTIQRAPGIGPKTAKRIVNELKDKTGPLMTLAGEMGMKPVLPGEEQIAAAYEDESVSDLVSASSAAKASADALSALCNLGYSQSEAVSAVAAAASNDLQATTETLIREALRHLGPS